jgi:hypothetical protein
MALKALCQASGLDPHAFSAALDAREQHDVVKCSNGVCQYTVELMRRWVAFKYRTRMDRGVKSRGAYWVSASKAPIKP